MTSFEGLASTAVCQLEEVQPDTDYALVISTSAGLWRYIIGDTVRFTQTKPYRFVVSGRTAHYINAFGEKLIIEHKKSGSRTLVDDIELVITMYDMSGYGNIQYVDF